MTDAPAGYTVLVLAGYRPAPDPICTHFDTRYKCLAPVQGRPMLTHVLDSLQASDRITRIIVLAQEPGYLASALSDYIQSGKIEYRQSRGGIARTLVELEDCYRDGEGVLVTTADNCLLTAGDVEQFLDQIPSEVDLCVGLVAKQSLLSRHPESRRTWIRLGDVEVTGCNLFLLRGEGARQVVEFWQQSESTRKKVMRMVMRLGPRLLWRYVRGRLTLTEAFAQVSALAGARVRPILLNSPEIAVDADKLSDIEQIERIIGYGPGRQPAAGPVPGHVPVVIFDLDRTITSFGTYTPFLVRHAVRHAPWRLLYAPLILLSMLGYVTGRVDRRTLKGWMFRLLVGPRRRSDLSAECADFVEQTLNTATYEEALRTIRAWQSSGAWLVLATASYDWLAEVFGRRLGFNQVVATRSVRESGRILPGTEGENCYGPAKRAMVEDVLGRIEELRAAGREVWFYTDHHSDISLLECISHPVCVNPTPKLRQWAEAQDMARVVIWRGLPDPERRAGRRRHPAVNALLMVLLVSSIVMAIPLLQTRNLHAEVSVDLDDVPAAAMTTVRNRIPDIILTHAEIEIQGGRRTYEVYGRQDQNFYEVEVTSGGQLLKVESLFTDPDGNLALGQVDPAAVAAVYRRFPGIHLTEVELESADKAVTYEFEGNYRGHFIEVVITADGDILTVEGNG